MTKAERKKRRQRWWKRVRDRERQLRIYRERRAAAISKLGGCCSICGSVDDLQIDHVNPLFKTIEFSRPHLSAWFDELENAQLLCFGCHLDKTADDRAHGRIRRRALRNTESAPF